MRPTASGFAADAHRQKGRILAAVLADLTRLTDPDQLTGNTIPADLFWEVTAALATERGLKVTAPTLAERDVIAAATAAVRSIRNDRERNEDPFSNFGLRPVQ